MTPWEQGLKEAQEYYQKAQADHVTEIVIEERKRRARWIKHKYRGINGTIILDGVHFDRRTTD